MIKRSLILSFAIVCFSVVTSRAEDVKITTYYPSPYGVYKGLSSTDDTNLATDPAAQVGIGTTTPNKKLVVDKTNVVGDGIMIRGTNDTRIMIGVGQPTVWSWANGIDPAHPGDFSLVEEGASGARMYVKPGGINGDAGIGINNNTPLAAFTVSRPHNTVLGDIRFFPDTFSNDITFDGGSDSLFSFRNMGASGGRTFFATPDGVERLSILNNGGAVLVNGGSLIHTAITRQLKMQVVDVQVTDTSWAPNQTRQYLVSWPTPFPAGPALGVATTRSVVAYIGNTCCGGFAELIHTLDNVNGNTFALFVSNPKNFPVTWGVHTITVVGIGPE